MVYRIDGSFVDIAMRKTAAIKYVYAVLMSLAVRVISSMSDGRIDGG